MRNVKVITRFSGDAREPRGPRKIEKRSAGEFQKELDAHLERRYEVAKAQASGLNGGRVGAEFTTGPGRVTRMASGRLLTDSVEVERREPPSYGWLAR